MRNKGKGVNMIQFTVLLTVLFKGITVRISVGGRHGGLTTRAISAIQENEAMKVVKISWIDADPDFRLYEEEGTSYGEDEEWDLRSCIYGLIEISQQFGLSGWTAQEIWHYDFSEDPILQEVDLVSEPTKASMRRREFCRPDGRLPVVLNSSAKRSIKHTSDRARR
jgi:hypothetical protein